MTAKTKKLSALCVAILAAPWGVATLGLTGRASWTHKEKSVGAAENTDAAYRDGFFWGQLDGRQGKKARVSIGRWNEEKDRASFKAGYEKGYREALSSKNARR